MSQSHEGFRGSIAELLGYYTYCRQYGPTRDALLSMCSAGIKSDH